MCYLTRDFASIIRLRPLSRGIILDCVSGLSVITTVLLGGRQEVQRGSRKKGYVKREAEMQMVQPGAKE